MNEVDVFILVIITLSASISYSQGLVKEVLSATVWLLALGFTFTFLDALTYALIPLIPFIDLRLVFALVLLFLFSFFLLLWLNYLLIDSILLPEMTLLERIVAMNFGVIRAGVLVLWLLFIAAVSEQVAHSAVWRTSLLIQEFEKVAWLICHLLPAEIVAQFHFQFTNGTLS